MKENILLHVSLHASRGEYGATWRYYMAVHRVTRASEYGTKETTCATEQTLLTHLYCVQAEG